MEIVKIRRVGNSNVVTLPRALEERGFVEGSQVVIEELPTGGIVLQPAEHLRDYIRAIARQVITEDREALDLLEEHDKRRDRASTEST